MRGRARTAGFVAVVVLVVGWIDGDAGPMLGSSRARAAEPVFWDKVASRQRDRADRLVQKAKDLLADAGSGSLNDGKHPQAADNLGRAEALLREALALDPPPDFSTLLLLAEVQSSRGHAADATASLERAESLARLPAQKAACWFRLGVERSKIGRYREALASYDSQIALGEADAAVYANAAELLMALGRLDEAEERYREAVRIDERAGDRRGREQTLALSYYGLGMALDRDHEEVASREAIGRALALDPNMSMLHLAQQPGADIGFIPAGDVFYCLGLAAEVAGRADDAIAAFAEYVSRQPRSAWTPRARAHLAVLVPPRPSTGAMSSPPAAMPAAPRPRWRVLAVATVRANGPIAAPMIDAALRQRPPAWDDCLAAFPAPRGHDTVRLVIELELDANGAVSRAAVGWPPAQLQAGAPGARAAGACIEAGLKDRLIVAKPAHGKATSARVEVLLANGDSGGL